MFSSGLLLSKHVNLCFRAQLLSAMSIPLKRLKPPNILVLLPHVSSSCDTSSVFQKIKGELQTCLGIERYAVYSLPASDITHKPWRDNCLLLIIPPSYELTNDELKQLVSFIELGGKCLIINNNLNQLMSSKLHIQQQCQIHDDVGKVLQVNPSDSTFDPFYAVSIPYTDRVINPVLQPDNVTTTVLANMSTKDDTDIAESNIVPCVQCISYSEYKYICSSIHLFDPISYAKSDMSNISKIKETTEARHKFLQSIFIDLGLRCSSSEMPALSAVYLASANRKFQDTFISSIQPYDSTSLQSSVLIKGAESSSLIIIDDYNIGTPVDPPIPSTEKQVTILARPSQRQLSSLDFDCELFFSYLTTKYLGRSLLIGPVMTSSQTLFTGNFNLTECMSNELGVVCTPGQQTKGKGRGSNVWISPKGCMMFSCPLKYTFQSRLSKRVSLIQHIVALSVVSAIRSMPGYENIPFLIKWPNDIYYKHEVKLGGILVTSYTFDKVTTAVIGCGVNVSNHYPTVSINDCITIYNNENQTQLPLLKLEQLLAGTLNKLEIYLSLYEEWGLSAIESLYYHYWMHQDSVVQLFGYPGIDSATITGINEYGYLRVCTSNGDILSLQPDGNTFDIMKGLICMN